ncbi:MAG: His/Gly/Thr/Pro-type tRNA ligase C-terminal domain-containing protein [Minisyncoccia bacterium]
MIYLEEQPKTSGKKGKKKNVKPTPVIKTFLKTEYSEWKNVDKATEVAIYYGFTPFDAPLTNKDDALKTKAFKKAEGLGKITRNTGSSLNYTVLESATMMRIYHEKFLNQPQPIMLALNGFVGQGKNKKTLEKKICLEILGSSRSVAEALAITTSIAILKEYKYEDISVEINSLGDRESISRFTREMTSYFRKNINVLPAKCRQTFKEDVLSLLACDNKNCLALNDEAPKALSCLSDFSREQFREILEYLEKLEIPYKINNCLVGNRDITAQTVFEIKGRANEKARQEVLVVGTRHDLLAKKFGYKKEIASLSVKLDFKNQIKNKDLVKKIEKPKLHFTQLGLDAKYKALSLIEFLRQNHILVNQSLSREKMGGQLIIAEKMKIPFVIIMGQKEALEDTVMVRNTKTRSQQTIPIKDLPEYIKNL